jgi:hypothetical protein
MLEEANSEAFSLPLPLLELLCHGIALNTTATPANGDPTERALLSLITDLGVDYAAVRLWTSTAQT